MNPTKSKKYSKHVEDLKEPYFSGNLLTSKVIERIAKQKTKKYYEKLVHKNLKIKYSTEGWYFEKERKNGIVMRKDKEVNKKLEDSIWILFKKMGFNELNGGDCFSIKTKSIIKKINVFAKDENNVFLIFCMSQMDKGPSSKPLKPEIQKIFDLKNDIALSIKKQYNKKLRVTYIFVTKNVIWDKIDKQFAEEKRINVWKEKDLEAYENLVEQLGICAKYQMFAVLFGDKEAFEVGNIKVPALRGGKGKGKYYSFVIQPERLFPIAYVHRREKTNASEVKNTYQRMVSKYRLDKIRNFVDKGGNFCNNIIVNFNKTKKKAKFDPNPKVKEIGGISYGILHFPPYYGCAWVIDGQHRLYGYSKSKKAKEHTIPVIAFENLSVMEQANLFVNINKEQAAVTTSLLWDLYPDIYELSENKEHQILKTISLVAKTLNSNKQYIFYNRIKIPSLVTHNKKITNLTLTNLCDAIKDNRLIGENENMLYNNDYNKTINYAAKRINVFFEVINENMDSDWERGDKGLTRTNVGLRIFFIIFRMLLRYLDHKGDKGIYKKNNLNEFKIKIKTILEPVFLKIKKMESQKIDDLRSASNKSMVLKNSQMLLWELFDKYQFGAELWKDGKGWSPPIPSEESDENIEKMVKDTEIELKNFIIKKLNEFHKEKWWQEGIPEGIKQNIRKNIENALSKAPYKRQEVLAYPYKKKFLLYSSTSDLKEVIKYSINWKQLEHIFGDVEYISSMLKSLENIRNAFIGHKERKEEIDEIQKNLSYWSTKWIRRCIGLDS